MIPVNRVKQIADLLLETARAHHKAFIEKDGEDPDWPLWYAEYMGERLGQLLGGNQYSAKELAGLLVMADKEHQATAQDSDWPHYYARFFLDRLP